MAMALPQRVKCGGITVGRRLGPFHRHFGGQVGQYTDSARATHGHEGRKGKIISR